MDRSGGVTLAGVLVGIIAGFPAGVLFAVARRAWRDHGTVSRSVGGLQRSAMIRTGELLVLGFLLLAVVAFALGNYGD